MISRQDTQRAVAILTRYQTTLRAPEEQQLKASIGKVSHIFRSDLFQALLDIQEFYELSLLSAHPQHQIPDPAPHISENQHDAGELGSPNSPGDPQHNLEDAPLDTEQRPAQGAQGRSVLGQQPQLVRVTVSSLESPASVCSLVVRAHSTLPKGPETAESSSPSPAGEASRLLPTPCTYPLREPDCAHGCQGQRLLCHGPSRGKQQSRSMKQGRELIAPSPPRQQLSRA